jgi:hypothetical protein
MFTYRWTNWQANGPFRFWYGMTRGQENIDHLLFNYAAGKSEKGSRQVIRPDQQIRKLYAAHKAGRGPFFQTKDRTILNDYFTKYLADMIWKSAGTTDGEVGALDFDPLYGSQDPQISNFTIMPTGWGGDRKFGPANEAVVQVAFKESGKARMVSYQFRQGRDKLWKIYDVHYRGDGDQVRLAEILTRAATGTSAVKK